MKQRSIEPDIMAEMWRGGTSMAEIARQAGVSRQRVQELLGALNISGKPPRPESAPDFPRRLLAPDDCMERIAVTTAHHKGRDYVCVRKWFMAHDGLWYPSSPGTNFRAELFTNETVYEFAAAVWGLPGEGEHE